MSNRVTYILAGGQLSLPFLKEQLNRHSDRTIIAADRGLEACVSLGIEPDFGDRGFRFSGQNGPGGITLPREKCDKIESDQG